LYITVHPVRRFRFGEGKSRSMVVVVSTAAERRIELVHSRRPSYQRDRDLADAQRVNHVVECSGPPRARRVTVDAETLSEIPLISSRVAASSRRKAGRNKSSPRPKQQL
jgi:hypothetical protein